VDYATDSVCVYVCEWDYPELVETDFDQNFLSWSIAVWEGNQKQVYIYIYMLLSV